MAVQKWLGIVMLIGQEIEWTGDQLLGIVHSLEGTWLLGRVRSRRLSLVQVLKLSIEPC
uniref:Uncharacterized protein n=1 Tax=Brassica oleracea var. oleracea TaxID=109376 RepID=A0A0D3DKR5_BRAOL